MPSDEDRDYEEFKAERAARRLKDAVKGAIKELVEEGEVELGSEEDAGEGGKPKKKKKDDDEEEAPKRGKGMFADYGIS